MAPASNATVIWRRAEEKERIRFVNCHFVIVLWQFLGVGGPGIAVPSF